jgi:hypothetical protein
MITLRVVPALIASLAIGGAWHAPPPAPTVFNVIGYYADWRRLDIRSRTFPPASSRM